MAQRFIHAHRRRPVKIVTANTPNGSPAVVAAARSRVSVVPRHPRKKQNPRTFVQSLATKRVTGVIQPPTPGAGGTPKPLQPIWTAGTTRKKTFRNIVRPIVQQQRFVAPKVDGQPNQVVVPAHQRPRRPQKPIASYPGPRIGREQGLKAGLPVVASNVRRRRVVPPILVDRIVPTPEAVSIPFQATIVPRPGPRKRLRGLVAVLPADAFEMPPPETARPIVVPRIILRRSALAIIADRFYDGTRQQAPHAANPIVVPRPARRKRLRGLAMILPADAYEIQPPTTMQPIVVPSRLKGNKARRDAILVVARSSVDPRLLPPTRSIVVPRRERPRLAPWALSSLYRKFVEAPPEHFPLPHVLVSRAPRRAPWMRPRPIVQKSAYQFPGNMVDKPWDLIAACIAWLYATPDVANAFGGAADATGRRKFFSDYALPKTSPPYAVFNEPVEVENYETPDDSGLRSSVAHGVFELEVFATEKLVARQLADMIARSLNDAPLVFTDGILLYLRRSERRYPTLRSPGDGENVTLYKRTLEFEYHIDRYF